MQVPRDYPISRTDAAGILVDDPDNHDDIVRSVRDVIEAVWRQRTDSIEKEACEILGVKELRDYIQNLAKAASGTTTCKRYSKSRRKAPIYWLLQSSKKNYALWIYYHRLDKDLLFKALVNYVEPKIRLEDSRLEALRTQKAAARRHRQGSQAARQGDRTAGRVPLRTARLRGQAASGGEPASRTRPQRWRRPQHRPAPRTRPVEGGQELLGRTPRRQVRVVFDRQAVAGEGAGEMLKSIKLHGVGPVRDLSASFGERLNVITGDNGLGKSFLLDVCFWSLTGTWPGGRMAIPDGRHKSPTISYDIQSKTKPASRDAKYDFQVTVMESATRSPADAGFGHLRSGRW